MQEAAALQSHHDWPCRTWVLVHVSKIGVERHVDLVEEGVLVEHEGPFICRMQRAVSGAWQAHALLPGGL